MRTLTSGPISITCSCPVRGGDCVCRRSPQGVYDISQKDLDICMGQLDYRAIGCIEDRGSIRKPKYAP